MQSADINNQNQAYLLVTHPSKGPVKVPLEENNSLFLGSGSSCRVVLSGRGIEAIHCMFWMNEEGVVRVQDWNTATGILINGENVSAETVINSGDELTVGDYSVVPVLCSDVHSRVGHHVDFVEPAVEPGETELETENAVAEPAALELAETESSTDEPPVSLEAEPHGEPQIEVQSEDPVEVYDESKVADLGDPVSGPSSEPEYDVLADLDELDELDDDDDFISSFGGNEDGFDEVSDVDQRQNEELELLRMEVEQLRFELAEREAVQADQVESADNDAQPDAAEYEGDENTVQLVNRLEELLEELRVSDERVRGLEDLLRASDQATQAEREERLQLESWVTEIEERVAERESESTAEMGRLKERLSESMGRHRQTQVQLKKVLKSNSGQPGADSSEMIAKLNEEVEALQLKLDGAIEENERLRQNPAPAQGDADSRASLKETEQKLVQLQVETSRERAEMARQKADLEHLRGELEEKLTLAKNSGNGDARLKAMREHLREIHEQEKLEREEKKRRSLGGRISRLLSKSSQ